MLYVDGWILLRVSVFASQVDKDQVMDAINDLVQLLQGQGQIGSGRAAV